MRFLIFISLCLVAARFTYAQQPASGFITTGDSVHAHLLPQPFNPPLHNAGSGAKKISLQLIPFGSLAGGMIMKERMRSASNGFLGLQFNLGNYRTWQVTAGYALAGGQLPDYLARTADSLRFIPGYGYGIHDRADRLYHAHYTFGSAAFQAGKFFVFDLGKGKCFWGDGHRSLILSDNAAPMPYARITTSVWKLRYTNLWMQLRDLSAMQTLPNARKKYAAMHSLSYDVSKKFNVSVYEWVIWQDKDTMSRRTIDLSYANPLIFYRPVEYTLGSPDNVILAASLRWDPLKKLRFYGQFVLDEFNLNLFKKNNNWWGNKVGVQAGMRWCPTESLCVRSEINTVRPFTYTHGSSIQAWTHLNQPMAHPLGANFIEAAQTILWQRGRWILQEQFNVAAFGRDYDANNDGTVDNFGGNLIRSYRDPFGGPFGHQLLQGELHKTIFHSLTLSRLVKASDHLEIFATHVYRREFTNELTLNDHMLLLGIRTRGLLQPVQDY
jgi:hypothetical protein